MALNSRDLRAQRMNVWKQMEEIYSRSTENDGGVPSFTPEDQTQYDKLDARYVELTGQIESSEKFEKRRNEMTAAEGEEIKSAQKDEEKRTKEDLDKEQAEKRSATFEKYFRFGIESLDRDELNILKRTQTVGSDAGGGYSVPDEQANVIEKTLADYVAMWNVSQIIRPGHGRTFFMPTNDDTANKGRIIAEGTGDASAGTTDLVLGQIQIDSYKYTSDLIKVSTELLEDNSVGFAGYLAEALSERLGRILNEHSTTGTGTSQPQGIVVGAGASGVTAGISALTRDNIVDLIHSVDPAYRRNASAALMFNDKTLAYIRKLSFGASDDRPLYQPSAQAGAPDLVEGEKFVINPDMADIGTGNKSMIYGALNKYMIRLGRGVQIKRAAERYIENDVIAWVGFMRFDGKLLNSSAVKSLVHA